MTTLQQAIEVMKTIPTIKVRKTFKDKIAARFLGKFKGVIPNGNGKTSTELIHDLRQTLYGKIR